MQSCPFSLVLSKPLQEGHLSLQPPARRCTELTMPLTYPGVGAASLNGIMNSICIDGTDQKSVSNIRGFQRFQRFEWSRRARADVSNFAIPACFVPLLECESLVYNVTASLVSASDSPACSHHCGLAKSSLWRKAHFPSWRPMKGVQI